MTIASNTITSMTGFARASGSHDGQAFAWELKSVNGKALDLRLRLPTGFDHLEIQVRQALAQVLKRGNVQVNLSLTETGGATKLTINRDVLQTYVALAKDLQKQVGGPDVSVEALLSMKGVVEMAATTTDETVLAARDKAILKSLDEAIVALAAARLAEGAKLSAIIAAQLDQIAELHKRATANPSRKADAIKARLREQVASLLEAGMMDEQRLAQEAAIPCRRASRARSVPRPPCRLRPRARCRTPSPRWRHFAACAGPAPAGGRPATARDLRSTMGHPRCRLLANWTTRLRRISGRRPK